MMQRYPAGAPQPLFWQALLAAVVNIAVTAVVVAQSYSAVKKSLGEAKPKEAK